jgi:hypothetical protein
MRTRGLAAGRRNAGTPGRAQGQRWIDSSIPSTVYTKRRVFSAKNSVSVADYAETCQQWRPRLITGDAGLHTRPQTTRWHLVRVANYRGRGAVCGIALIARRTVEEREKGWNVPRSQAPWSHCWPRARAGRRRSAFSKAIIACVWRLETCEAETRKGSTAEQTPHACTCLSATSIYDHIGCGFGTRNAAFAKV